MITSVEVMLERWKHHEGKEIEHQVQDEIFKAGYHVDVDTTDRKIQKKVREAQLVQYNYILVVGEEEANTGQVSVRVRDKADHSVMSIENLLKHFVEEVAAFHYVFVYHTISNI
nr:threonine--trna ligase, mitochondrial 1 [Quercus suber]